MAGAAASRTVAVAVMTSAICRGEEQVGEAQASPGIGTPYR
jgi:hypothetical protein